MTSTQNINFSEEKSFTKKYTTIKTSVVLEVKYISLSGL